MNLIPYQGSAIYIPNFLNTYQSLDLYESLLNETPWKQDEVIIYGKKIITSRKTAWYGNDKSSYAYSGITRMPIPFTTKLLELKKNVDQICEAEFNSCLLNLYHHGMEGMGWHSDNEKELGINPCIASLSLGTERRFYFKHKTTKEQIKLILEPGSLLIMSGEIQHYWLHSVPKSKKIGQPRINLTFREIKKAN